MNKTEELITQEFETDFHCQSCVQSIRPIIEKYKIKTHEYNSASRILSVSYEAGTAISEFVNDVAKLGYTLSTPSLDNKNSLPRTGFWGDIVLWKRASFNTLNCLIGCSIGDFGMILYLQAFHPGVSMMLQMTLAILAGLCTSILLEATLLRYREQWGWSRAFRVAWSMSFISMVGMEIAMNVTDFAITGGSANFSSIIYWLAFLPSAVAGFVFPLPYNYYKLKKYGKACH